MFVSANGIVGPPYSLLSEKGPREIEMHCLETLVGR